MTGDNIAGMIGVIIMLILIVALVWFIGPVVTEHRQEQENIAHGADTLSADPYARQGETRAPGGARIAADYIYARERTYFSDDPEGPPLHPIKDIDVFVARRFFGPPIDIYADPFEAPYIDTAGKPGRHRRELGTVDPALDYVDTAHPDTPPHPGAGSPPAARATPTRMSPPEETTEPAPPGRGFMTPGPPGT